MSAPYCWVSDTPTVHLEPEDAERTAQNDNETSIVFKKLRLSGVRGGKL